MVQFFLYADEAEGAAEIYYAIVIESICDHGSALPITAYLVEEATNDLEAYDNSLDRVMYWEYISTKLFDLLDDNVALTNANHTDWHNVCVEIAELCKDIRSQQGYEADDVSFA